MLLDGQRLHILVVELLLIEHYDYLTLNYAKF